MLKKKCVGCGKKIDKKFGFCPYCGMSFKKQREDENFGMIGRDDSVDLNQGFDQNNLMGLPFGFDKIVGGLMKQLEKQLGEMDGKNGGMPKGFKIQISSGRPQIRKVAPQKSVAAKRPLIRISAEEIERRRGLEKVDAESNVRRLADRLVYEIQVDGVKSGKDVVVTNLEQGI